MLNSRRWPLLFFLLLFTGHTALAQDDDDVVRVNTELVIINVTVTDGAGNYVRKLRKADFKVFENGKEVDPNLIVGFALQESPYASVVLIDSSASMEQRMILARSGAIRFLDGLREEDVAAVYRFDSKVERVQNFSGGRDLSPLGYGIRAKGMTTLNDAILEASHALAQRPEQRKAIVVLSDGADTFSKASTSKAIEAALEVGASIYTVDMSSIELPGDSKRQAAGSLKEFAEKTGGRFITTPGGPELRDAFKGIAEELGQQYTLAYKPLNRERDGKWRTLEVRVSKPELQVRARKGYRAPKN